MEARAMTLRTSLPGRLFLALVLTLITSAFASAQTSVFTYQGRFTDAGSAANGTYDMQFKLFDGTGNQIGATITNGAVQVSSGIFAVQLDFGAAAFPGADRFLEIGVRSAGNGEAYTVLAPRQQLTSAVYAIRAGSTTTADMAISATTATNATQLGGVAANQYVLTGDSRLNDARTPTAGSANYIQNTNSQQAANFNISGDGAAAGTLSANVVNSATQFNIGGKRVLLAGPSNNTFVGQGSGNANTFGFLNSFFGMQAGFSNTGGAGNSFFGANAGEGNTDGDANSMFGNNAGSANKTGGKNSYFGNDAGSSNDTGNQNSFFGTQSGYRNLASRNSYFGFATGFLNTTASDGAFFGYQAGLESTGANNSFFGSSAGAANTNGFGNSFFGFEAGKNNLSGSTNTMIGALADTASGNLGNATAIGYAAQVSQSNSLVLGSIKGVGVATVDTNVGIGTPAPAFRLTVKTATGNYGMVHTDGTVTVGSFVGGSTGGGWFGTRSNHSLSFFTNDGGPAMTLETSGFLRLNNVDAGGQLQLCLGPTNRISFCSSSLRYKTALKDFKRGLNVVNRLRPITFDWKEGGMRDLGFGAEDVAAVEPLLVTRNDKGQVEGVKYDRISAVLVNAVQEQQAEIAEQRAQLAQQHSELLLQRQQIEELKQIVSKKFGPTTGRRKR
jgi:hypothetical protein